MLTKFMVGNFVLAKIQPMTTQSQRVLFIGGPLHGTTHDWADPPDYHPHVTVGGMLPYSRRSHVTLDGIDTIYAPIGMTHSTIAESLGRIPLG